MADPGSWDLLDEDCADISDWVDADAGDGESSVDPAGQFKFLVPTAAGATNVASRNRDIGDYPNISTIEARLYCNAIGTRANSDYFSLQFRQADERFFLTFASDGLRIYDNDAGDTEVGTDLVKEGGAAEWQTWRFLVTFGAVGDGVCDVYLLDSTHNWDKVGTAIPCSYEVAGTDGEVHIFQYAYNTANRQTHIDHIKIATGLYAPSPARRHGFVNFQDPGVF